MGRDSKPCIFPLIILPSIILPTLSVESGGQNNGGQDHEELRRFDFLCAIPCSIRGSQSSWLFTSPLPFEARRLEVVAADFAVERAPFDTEDGRGAAFVPTRRFERGMDMPLLNIVE